MRSVLASFAAGAGERIGLTADRTTNGWLAAEGGRSFDGDPASAA
jgi:hypothetical protein